MDNILKTILNKLSVLDRKVNKIDRTTTVIDSKLDKLLDVEDITMSGWNAFLEKESYFKGDTLYLDDFTLHRMKTHLSEDFTNIPSTTFVITTYKERSIKVEVFYDFKIIKEINGVCTVTYSSKKVL